MLLWLVVGRFYPLTTQITINRTEDIVKAIEGAIEKCVNDTGAGIARRIGYV